MAASRGNTDQPATETGPDPTYDPAGEVVELCRDLIRIDTSNYGDQDGPGERKAAEHVASLLDEVGIEARLYESEPGRRGSRPRTRSPSGSPRTSASARSTSSSAPPD